MKVMPAWRVVYPHLTDNSRMGESGKIVSFHQRERGHRHGAEPAILPTPIGRSRVDQPHDPCLVARPSKRHAPDAPQAGQAPMQALQSAQAFHRADPQTAMRGL